MSYLSNTQNIEFAVNSVLSENPEKFQKYQRANYREKLRIRGFFVGMTFKKLSGQGKGNLQIIKEVLNKRLG